MRSELQTVLDSLQRTPTEKLPELLGELEVIRATVALRLSAPPVPQLQDELLSVAVAAKRLGISTDYLYRHAGAFPFTRHIGRCLRFSSVGIDRHIAQNKVKSQLASLIQ